VNFVGSHHASEDVKRPHSSLLAKFWQVSASETATEAATGTIKLAHRKIVEQRPVA
jgi:hypothetical protein